MTDGTSVSDGAGAPDVERPNAEVPGGLAEDDLRTLDREDLKRLVEARRRARSGGRREREDDPREVGRLVSGLLEKWGLADAVARAELFRQWEDRVGDRVAERARPARFDEGTLFVEVESASWLTELRMMKRQLLERLNAGRERGRVEEIVFVQGGRSERESERSRRNRERGRS